MVRLSQHALAWAGLLSCCSSSLIQAFSPGCRSAFVPQALSTFRGQRTRQDIYNAGRGVSPSSGRTQLLSTPVLEPRTEDLMPRKGGRGPVPDPLQYLAEQFEGIYNRALNGRAAQLKGLFGAGAVWEGLPLGDNKGPVGIQDALDIIEQGRSFVIDPRLTVTNVTVNRAESKVDFEWILSGTWPLPYRPRVAAAGRWSLAVQQQGGSELGFEVKSVRESWDKPWWRSVLEQAAPRLWDVWHLYLTPPAERPLYRVLKKFPTFELREYYPRLAIQLESVDSRPDDDKAQLPSAQQQGAGGSAAFTDLAWVLPDFAFTDELKLQGRAQYRETYVTTSPVEVAVESIKGWLPPTTSSNDQQQQEGVTAKRIRWHIPMPSHLGFDTSALPDCAKRDEFNASTGDAARYVLEGRRVMAVRPFKGLSQTEKYAHARRLLLRFVQKEGLRTVKNASNKSRVWVWQNNMKAGFNMDGHLCLAIYEQPNYTEMGEIAVQVDCPDPESFLAAAGSSSSRTDASL